MQEVNSEIDEIKQASVCTQEALLFFTPTQSVHHTLFNSMQRSTPSQNDSKSSDDRAFQPEQPRRGPQVGTSRLGQGELELH